MLAKLAAYRAGTLVITTAGLAAIGELDTPSGRPIGYVLPEEEVVEPPNDFEVALGAVADAARVALAENEPATTEPSRKAAPAESDKPTKAPRADSKQPRLIEMLRRPEGVTIDEVVKALDWQAHTVRGAISGALKKKLGLTIKSEKVDTRGRVYRIAG